MARKEDMKAVSLFAVMAIVLLCCTHSALGLVSKDPTQGFVSLPLNNSNFVIQRPYDVPESARYSFVDGVHKLWVYATDKPHTRTGITRPRTEIRIHGYDYSSGVWQFEGYGFVPTGTSGVSIMQVTGASKHATTVMMRVYNGSLSYYKNPIIVPQIYDRWFRLNVIHDVGAKKVSIFIDGVAKFKGPDHGGATHHFKFGVYAHKNSSRYMESRWKDVKVLRKIN